MSSTLALKTIIKMMPRNQHKLIYPMFQKCASKSKKKNKKKNNNSMFFQQNKKRHF